MGKSPVGSVILIEFPQADMTIYKKRPAIVVGHGSLDTVIICQVTSKLLDGLPSVSIKSDDFASGSLPVDSFVRPDKLHTIDAVLADQRLGSLNKNKISQIKKEIVRLFS